MKKFVSENWYKLMIGSSLLMASFGFMVHSISPAHAEKPSNINNSSEANYANAALFNSNSSPDGGAYYWVASNGYAYQIFARTEGNGAVTYKLKLN